MTAELDAMFMFGGLVIDPESEEYVPSREAWRYQLSSNRWTPHLLGANHVHPRYVLATGFDRKRREILMLDSDLPDAKGDVRLVTYEAATLASTEWCSIRYDEDYSRYEVVGMADGSFMMIRGNEESWEAWRLKLESGVVTFVGRVQGDGGLFSSPFLSDLGVHVPIRGEMGPEFATLQADDFEQPSSVPSCL